MEPLWSYLPSFVRLNSLQASHPSHFSFLADGWLFLLSSAPPVPCRRLFFSEFVLHAAALQFSDLMFIRSQNEYIWVHAACNKQQRNMSDPKAFIRKVGEIIGEENIQCKDCNNVAAYCEEMQKAQPLDLQAGLQRNSKHSSESCRTTDAAKNTPSARLNK